MGGIDVKVLDNKLMSEESILVRSGPTFGYNDNIKAFNFSMFVSDNSIKEYKQGLPNVYDFDSIIFHNDMKDN